MVAILLAALGELGCGVQRPLAGDLVARQGLPNRFLLMGADPRLDDARWLLDWIGRSGRAQFSRRDAHAAGPRGRFPKATDLDPALRLLEEHGWLRRVDADRPVPRAADRPRRGSWSTPCHAPQNPQNPQNLIRRPVLRVM